MTYTPRYQVEMPANPTIPGLATTVTQVFDGTQLTDRYIKQACNALRTHGTLPRWGGMYQLVALASRQLGTAEPIGFSIRSWCGAVVQGINPRTLDTKLKKYFSELIKLSQVRHNVQLAASSKSPFELDYERDRKCEWGEYGLRLLGWEKPHATMPQFREALTKTLDKIPGYRDDMRRIADWLETRPTVTLTSCLPIKVVERKAGGNTKLAV